MVQVCSRCHRVNPREAAFCYFDGVVLRQGAAVPSAGVLPLEFVFPSGRRCRSFDDLVQGCQYEWEDARELLRTGELGRYLARVGRMDLVRAAEEAQAQPDRDIALYNFLGNLPAGQVQGPRLDLHPRRLILGAVRPGDQRPARLQVTNQGKGLLQGRLTVTEGGLWLKVADGGAGGDFPIKTGREQQVPLRIDARALAAPQTYSGKLRVITNGGIAEVPVRLDVTAVPFPGPPFQGAGTPREMAERMRTNPKPAVPLLENGEVARWFAANGWAYPVVGPPARGVAAVQQFFEAMGLSKPPPLQLSEHEVRFVCAPPEVVRGQVTLRTPAKKWVYAHADSDAPWLRVTTPSVSGPQQAPIAFEVDSTLLDEDRVHDGAVKITANAGQSLSVRVRVDVRRPYEPAARRLLRPVLAGAVAALLLRLLLAVPADLFARVLATNVRAPAPGTLARWLHPPAGDEHFLKLFVLATWWLGALAGVGLVWRRGGRGTDLFCGLVAGAGAGLVTAATAGCLLILVDALPRALLPHEAAGRWASSPWLCTPLWIFLAAACWGVLGGGLGLLLSGLGRRGARVLGALTAPFARVLRLCGLPQAAQFFVLHG